MGKRKKPVAQMIVTKTGIIIRKKRMKRNAPAKGRATGTWYPDRTRE